MCKHTPAPGTGEIDGVSLRAMIMIWLSCLGLLAGSILMVGCIQPAPSPWPPQPPIPIVDPPIPPPVDPPVPPPKPPPKERDVASVDGTWEQFRVIRDAWQDGKVYTKAEVESGLGKSDGTRQVLGVGTLYVHWLKAEDGSARDAYAGYNAAGNLAALQGG